MSKTLSLRELLAKGPLIAPGAYDALTARIAVQAGAAAVYMTGFGIAGSLRGVQDIGIVSATEMIERARALSTTVRPVPLIADGDNGHGGPSDVEHLVRAYEQAGVAAIQIEDQVLPKRCGHMDGKQVVPMAEGVEKIKAAVRARNSRDFLVIARTDARSVNGLDDAFRRADAYIEVGADLLFVEAPQSEQELSLIAERFRGIPLVANMVEDGKTPRLGVDQLEAMGYRLILYPISSLLAVARTAQRVYAAILGAGPHPLIDRVTFSQYNDIVRPDEISK